MDVKNPTTITEQINILKNRGCIIDNTAFAERVLRKINYYRFTAYFLPFKRNDHYINGLTFEKVHNIYEFDRKLRGIIFPIIEEIETMLRFSFAYHHAHQYGALGYMDASNFNKAHRHSDFENHINRMISLNKNQIFVKHHIEKYDSKFPIWVIIELFSMGELSLFYSDMIVSDKKILAKQLYDTSPDCLASWLHCFTLLRNYCAHYSRLYYNIFHATPKSEKKQPYEFSNKLFDYIYVLKRLYDDIDDWDTELFIPLQALIEKYSDDINLKHINFPDNWIELLR
jgi:Abortive infection bacteriophage resistance protein